jgi:hypothetical protein
LLSMSEKPLVPARALATGTNRGSGPSAVAAAFFAGMRRGCPDRSHGVKARRVVLLAEIAGAESAVSWHEPPPPLPPLADGVAGAILLRAKLPEERKGAR